MAAQVHLNNFRFSIYIDADGTVTLTDLPPELREVVAALDPSYRSRYSVLPAGEATAATADGLEGRSTSDDGGQGLAVTDSCRRMA